MTVDSTPIPPSPSARMRIGAVARMLGVSPSWVRQLADEGVLPSERTTGGHRVFDSAAVREAWERQTVELPPLRRTIERTPVFFETFAAQGLQEHLVWRAAEPDLCLGQHPEALGVAHYALTEMINNAVDHSGCQRVSVRISSVGEDLEFVVTDDGVGVFEHVRSILGLDSREDALLELSKGKRTTDPARHSGEGIFFTSKAVALFELEANSIVWMIDNRRSDQAVGESTVLEGTRVRFTVSRHESREIGELFREFTDDEFRFNRSRPSVALAQLGTVFVSRSEARRLVETLDRFEEVEIDFSGVTRVGQGFADEVFRVWATSHSRTRLIPVGMSPMVEFMVRRSHSHGPTMGL